MKIKIIEKTLKNMNILYLEEDEQYKNEVGNALQLKCDNVFYASNINEAVEIYNSSKIIDIIITEIKFDKKTGLNFIQNIRKLNKNIPIIVISSIIDIKILLEVIKLNLTEYILKPIDSNILLNSLHRAVLSLYDTGSFEIRFNNNSLYNVRKKILLDENKNVVKLSKNEAKLIDLLILNQEALLSVQSIKNLIWEDEYDISDEGLKSLINRLRQKIGKDSIRNISSSGYLINIKND
jgi:two-component system response regulator VanR